jgi:hypothetical protein
VRILYVLETRVTEHVTKLATKQKYLFLRYIRAYV